VGLALKQLNGLVVVEEQVPGRFTRMFGITAEPCDPGISVTDLFEEQAVQVTGDDQLLIRTSF
jgi:hypothetical protein